MPRPQLDAEWVKLCNAIGAEDMARGPNYDNPKARRAACAEIVARLDKCFSQKTLEEWGKILDEIDFVWAPLLRPAEVLEDEQANAMGAFVEIPEGGGGGKRRSVGGPIRFVDTSATPMRPVQKLGEANEVIMKELGFTSQEIDAMKKEKVLG